MPDIIIRGNKINFVESEYNLGVIFNGRLTWSNKINVIMGKVYGMLRILWAVIDSAPFAIRMRLTKTFVIPVLLYGSEIFGNCHTDDGRKLNLAYNNIARYVFIKGCRDHISQFSYRIFEINFDNLLNIKCLTLLHKIITLEQLIHLFRRIKLYRHKALLSQRQFFIHTTSLWNTLLNYMHWLCN